MSNNANIFSSMQKNAENNNLNNFCTSGSRSMLSIHCVLYSHKSYRFVKKQEEEFLLFFIDMNMVKRLVTHPGVIENTVKIIFHETEK